VVVDYDQQVRGRLIGFRHDALLEFASAVRAPT
jgi:hypothetical protein